MCSMSVSSYDLAYVDLEVLVFLVFSIPSALPLCQPLLLESYLNPERRDLIEMPSFGPSVPRSFILCIMSVCGSLYVLPSTAEGRFSGDGQSRHCSMNTVEYH